MYHVERLLSRTWYVLLHPLCRVFYQCSLYRAKHNCIRILRLLSRSKRLVVLVVHISLWQLLLAWDFVIVSRVSFGKVWNCFEERCNIKASTNIWGDEEAVEKFDGSWLFESTTNREVRRRVNLMWTWILLITSAFARAMKLENL